MSPPVIQFPPRSPVFQSVSPGPGDVFPALVMPFFLGIVKHCQHDEWQKYHAPYGLSRVFYAPHAFGVGRWYLFGVFFFSVRVALIFSAFQARPQRNAAFFFLLFLPDLNTTAVATIPSERRNQTPPAAFFFSSVFFPSRFSSVFFP